MNMEALEKQAEELHGEAVTIAAGLRSLNTILRLSRERDDYVLGIAAIIEALADKLVVAADNFDSASVEAHRAAREAAREQVTTPT